MKQIIALGGGGFSMEPKNPLLDLYILNQSQAQKPKICFVPTASGDSENYIARFYKTYSSLDCTPSHLSLFKPPAKDLRSFVLDKDIIFVGGGNTKNLLALWKDWGLDLIMHEAWEKGSILSGISAGSICWFEEGVTDSYGDLEKITGLGFLKGSNCPHFHGEKDRRPTFTNLIRNNKLSSGYGVDDSAALHFINDEFYEAVNSMPLAKAFYLQNMNGTLNEQEMKMRYLGN